MSLEVDKRRPDAEGIIPDDARAGEKVYVNGPQGNPYWSFSSPDKAVSQQPKRSFFGLSNAVFGLSLALIAALILAAVTAGVAGSIAVRRQHTIDQLHQSEKDLLDQISAASNTSSPLNSTTSSNATTPLKSTLADFLPKQDECLSLRNQSPTYTTPGQIQFTLHCNSDLETGNNGIDLLGVGVYTFEDCINACGKYNQGSEQQNSHCYAVSLCLNCDVAKGNCWLKGKADMPLTTKSEISSAVLNTS